VHQKRLYLIEVRQGEEDSQQGVMEVVAAVVPASVVASVELALAVADSVECSAPGPGQVEAADQEQAA